MRTFVVLLIWLLFSLPAASAQVVLVSAGQHSGGGFTTAGPLTVQAAAGGYSLNPVILDTNVDSEDDATPELPSAYALKGNYPNPFNPQTTIAYDLPQASQVQVQVYDLMGRVVQTLVHEWQVPGSYTAGFDAQHLASGVYFYRLEAGTFSMTRSMTLMK